MVQDCQIILTDDDADDRCFLAEAFQRNEFKGNLLEAGNGLQLLSLLDTQFAVKKASPDIIILDLNMPILNGYQALNKLKKDNSFQKIPVVVLTSSSKQEDEKWCMEAGCFKYYKKPFHISGYDEIARDILLFIRRWNSCC
ncbi:response regulator [Longitalea arenae]|uniref:response regulator n=1 Tax=Longitalea arenae TaxID=2812558 RepID=UPI001967B5C3|nr:response regulator [Longitalea arenae]